LRTPFVVAEFALKRTLATLLWIAWQSRLHPFMFLRGKMHTPGRFYIEHFLNRHAAACQGVFLEFGDPQYRSFFKSEQIERYDILDVQPGPTVTIVADLQDCPQIEDNTYDVIICTQVLEHVPNPFKAVAELHRILKPGGHLIVTVPAAYPYHAVPRDYWRFTKDSLELLFNERFKDAQVTSYGNRLTAVAVYWYWMQDHLPRAALLKPDPANPTLLAVSARK
jgi:SAM-dependent methyltransferase